MFKMSDLRLEDVQKNSFLFLQNFDYYDTYRKAFEKAEVEDHVTWLRETFFSDANADKIQRDLARMVYEKSNNTFIIGPQKREHMMQIMEGIYKDYCQNLPFNLKQQIEELNKIVVDFCYPYAIRSAKAFVGYQESVANGLRPPPLPESVSMAGKKTLPSTFLPL
jgi:hypothetical protein